MHIHQDILDWLEYGYEDNDFRIINLCFDYGQSIIIKSQDILTFFLEENDNEKLLDLILYSELYFKNICPQIFSNRTFS